jgi:lysozyme
MSQQPHLANRDRLRNNLIRHFEASGNVRTDAYLDSEGIPTIGWGATTYADGRPVRLGDKVTPQQAEELFTHHVNRSINRLRAIPAYTRLNPNQQAALESFAYNAGPNFVDSRDFATMATAIKNGDVKGIEQAFSLYTNGGTPGLVRRRQAEQALFRQKVEQDARPDPTVRQRVARQQQQQQNHVQSVYGFLNGFRNFFATTPGR